MCHVATCNCLLQFNSTVQLEKKLQKKSKHCLKKLRKNTRTNDLQNNFNFNTLGELLVGSESYLA